RAVDRAHREVMFTSKGGEGKGCPPQRVGVILGGFYRPACEPNGLRDFLLGNRSPALHSLDTTAPTDQYCCRWVRRTNRDCPLRKGNRLAHPFLRVFVLQRQSAQVQIVGIEF